MFIFNAYSGYFVILENAKILTIQEHSFEIYFKNKLTKSSLSVPIKTFRKKYLGFRRICLFLTLGN